MLPRTYPDPVPCRRIAWLAVWLRQQGTAVAHMSFEPVPEMHSPLPVCAADLVCARMLCIQSKRIKFRCRERRHAAQVLEKMNNISCGGRCATGSGGKSVGGACIILHAIVKGIWMTHSMQVFAVWVVISQDVSFQRQIAMHLIASLVVRNIVQQPSKVSERPAVERKLLSVSDFCATCV